MIEFFIGIAIALLLFIAGIKFESSRGKQSQEMYRIAELAIWNYSRTGNYLTRSLQHRNCDTPIDAVSPTESSPIGKASSRTMDSN